MKPKRFNEANAIYGANQPDYLALPAHKTKEGQAIFCFELDEEERKRIAETGEVWISVLTFNRPLQPIYLTTEKKDIFISEEYESSSSNIK